MSGIKDGRTASNPFGFGQLSARKDARTLTKREQQDRGEEERLLGGSSGSDPNAVPIIPGVSIQRTKVGQQFNFKPRNTLDRDPTRPAYSRPKYQFHSTPGPAVARARGASHEGSTESPRKKLKLETSATPTAKVIEIDDDDPPVQFTSSQKASCRPHKTRSPSFSSDNGTGNQRPTSRTTEFWDVEAVMKPPTGTVKQKPTKSTRMVGNIDKDEAFTREAREERVRSQLAGLGQKSQPRAWQLKAVEIPVQKSNKRTGQGNNPELRNKFASTDAQSRNDTPRESPDELQGEKTVSDVWRQAEARHNISRSSPNDIPPTNLSPASGKKLLNGRQMTDIRKKKQSRSIFSIQFIRFDDQTLHSSPCRALELVLDEDSECFFVESQKTRLSRYFDINRINHVICSDDEGNKKIRLKYPGSQIRTNNNVDIEFSNEKDYCSFQAIISQPDLVRVLHKTKNWMDNAFARPVYETKSPTVATKRQNVKDTPGYESLSPESPKPKRQKLSERLQNGNEPVEREVALEQPKAPDTSQRSGVSRLDGSHDILTHSHPSPNKESREVEIPVKTFKDPNRSTRQTRSQAKPQNYVLDSDDDATTSLSPAKIRGGKWTKPLVYPKIGKKKAEVEAQDLDRLNDHEFLNDNLIGFYIRFLEHHLERTSPDLAKRIYFFNSYFYASLTNKPRGMRGINYQAVAKWTRSVDLLSYDYVVVPINESAHWYIAIICNLPNLVRLISEPEPVESTQEDGDTAKGSQDDVQEIPPSSTAASEDREAMGDNSVDASLENGKDDRLRESFSLMTLQDPVSAPVPSPSRSGAETPAAQEQPASDKDDWPDEEENQQHQTSLILKGLKNVPPRNETSSEQKREGDQTATKSSDSKPGKKKGKKPRPPVQKLDPRQPVIITFDSLGCSRPHTVRILKDYLEEEADSKRSLRFDSSKFIKGMTAKDIPLQPNFSDCGLYLLAYLEKFIRDPDEFVNKLLRKEMKREVDWPTMKSGVFRRRLRQFLHDLYEEQYGEKSKDSGRPQLVDSKPLHILLVEDEPAVSGQKSSSPQLGKPSSPEPKSRPKTPEKGGKEGPGVVEVIKNQSPVRSSPRFKPSDEKKQPTVSPARTSNRPKEVEKEAPETVEIIDSQTPVRSPPRSSLSNDKKQPAASSAARGSSRPEPDPPRDTEDSMLFEDLEEIFTGHSSEKPAPLSQKLHHEGIDPRRKRPHLEVPSSANASSSVGPPKLKRLKTR